MINYNQSDLNLLNDLHDIVGQDYETGKHDLIEFMFNLLAVSYTHLTLPTKRIV